MKKLILLLSLLLLFTSSACEEEETGVIEDFEYSDFTDISVTSHGQAEGMSNNKYIVYYYSPTCSHCNEVKQDILDFANEYVDIDFYLFDIMTAGDQSSIEEFVGTPTVMIYSGTQISDIYIGKIKVMDFINEYTDQVFEYDSFESQHLDTYQEILDIERDTYLVYFYLENCQNCMAIKDQVLSWAFTKSAYQVYFVNSASINDPDNIPTELQIAGSGTPLLIVMSNGEFTDEYYSGKDDIVDFIVLNGTSDLD